MTRFKSAFAVPSGFAVATRTAAKGKTTATQDLSAKPASAARSSGGRGRPTNVIASPVRAA